MGVSAVPGSGKTRTLSYLAASLVADGGLRDDQEVLIVTLVNAAADHFSRQVGAYVSGRGLLANVGYRVRTLHGLANDILRERPELAGLTEKFSIIDEREADDILYDAVSAWVKSNPRAADVYVKPNETPDAARRIIRDRWPYVAKTIASAFIRQAKDAELEPPAIRRLLDARPQFLPLAHMGLDIYINYQRALNYRGGIDFQDLIRLALRALQADRDYLARLRDQWPYILEDEAQDSSQLQEKIISLLAGEGGNWVRVGDPNQAIYETFTTARPEYLRGFIARPDVVARELPNSGRSTRSIMRLANHLIEWSARHPVEAVRQRQPLSQPYILPTPDGDPQPNPPDDPAQVVLYGASMTADEETKALVTSLKRWMPENPERTVAVLVPRNERGAHVVAALKQAGLDVLELLRSSSTTRETAGALSLILTALAEPQAGRTLAGAFRVWRRDDRHDSAVSDRLERLAKLLAACQRVEDYLYPIAGRDWLDGAAVGEALADYDDAEADTIRDLLDAFRRLMRRWHAAVILPVDQLILTVAGDLFTTSADLAIAHSLANILKRDGQTNPHFRLPEFAAELRAIAQNKRRVLDLTADADQHDPDQHRGKVTVATMHAAKGLEWDRVYLLSVNNYDFPSAEPHDTFIGESWWVRDSLNLQAEAIEQLLCAVEGRVYQEAEATRAARVDYAAERLRLLFVGITRARQQLVITWNTGRQNQGEAYQATPFIALQSWWESARYDDADADNT